MLQSPVEQSSRDLLLHAHTTLVDQVASQLEAKHQKERDQACRAVKEKCEADTEAQLKRLRSSCEQEGADARQQLEAALAESKQMSALRDVHTKQFRYIARGCEASSGSVPRQIFEAEPGSLLNRMYNGEWEYAKDDTGQALVNSSPAHWACILDWLSFGCVPIQPTQTFLAECRYWQLSNLLAQIEEQQKTTPAQPDVQTVFKMADTYDVTLRPHNKGGKWGFILEGHILNFGTSLTANPEIEFKAWGMSWSFLLGHLRPGLEGVGMLLCKGPKITKACLTVTLGPEEYAWSPRRLASASSATSFGGCGISQFWYAWSPAEVERLQHPPCVDWNGSLPIRIELLFAAAAKAGK